VTSTVTLAVRTTSAVSEPLAATAIRAIAQHAAIATAIGRLDLGRNDSVGPMK
jgi:hypothetical protein